MNEDITKEVNFYKKDLFNLNTHYRTNKISEYMQNESVVEHIQYGYPYAYTCLNEQNCYTRLIRENEHNDLIVDEGLIVTYPANKAYKVFRSFCDAHLDKELLDVKLSDTSLHNTSINNVKIIDAKKDEYEEETKPLNKIWFTFPFYKDKDLNVFVAKLADSLYVCGYNYATKHTYSVAVQPLEKNIFIVVVLFEAKYYEENFTFAKYLYHVTTIDKLPKIKKIGLVPYSKSAKFDYPERVYLFNNVKQDIMFDYIETKVRGTNINEIAILKIDSDKLQNSTKYKNGKMKFYIDNMFEDIAGNVNAIFTYNNIDAALLEQDALFVKLDNGKIT